MVCCLQSMGRTQAESFIVMKLKLINQTSSLIMFHNSKKATDFSFRAPNSVLQTMPE